MRTAGVVFAAGASRRMGKNKMLLELDGELLVRRSAARAIAAGLSPVVVVVGFEKTRVGAALRGLDVKFAVNSAYEGPMSGSMHTAIRALPPDVDALIVLLGDMVHVTDEMIRAVADAGKRSGAPLAVSRYGDVTAPPILFTRRLFGELLVWTGDGCGKPVVRDHTLEAAFCEWPADRLGDVDTPDDWRALTNQDR